MNDDIVTRLRNETDLFYLVTLVMEAADEIERLRQIIDDVDELHNWGKTDDPCCQVCGVWPCPTHLLVCGECRRPHV